MAARITGTPGASSSPHSLGNKIARAIWGGVWLLLFRPSPKVLWGWRRFLLRCFGARIGIRVRVLPSAKIWLPKHLAMGDFACLGDGVDLYCVAPVTVGAYATISQRAFICTGSHDIGDPAMRLIAKPIVIGDYAWVCAESFVAPGVTVGEGAVAGARSVVTKDVEAWNVVVGNPAKVIGKRRISNG